MSETIFPQVAALCDALRARPEGLTEATAEAWKRAFAELPSLAESEVAGVFNDYCRANQKKKRERIGTEGIEPSTGCI